MDREYIVFIYPEECRGNTFSIALSYYYSIKPTDLPEYTFQV